MALTETNKDEINIDAIWPVGSIYISVSDTNPSTYFGGTWAAFATGRTLVGVDTGQTEFDTVLETGGAKTHTHTLTNAAAMIGSPSGNANALGFKNRDVGDLTGSLYSVGNTSSATAGGHPNRSHNTGLTGSTDSTSQLPPYITVYMWRRTA